MQVLLLCTFYLLLMVSALCCNAKVVKNWEDFDLFVDRDNGNHTFNLNNTSHLLCVSNVRSTNVTYDNLDCQDDIESDNSGINYVECNLDGVNVHAVVLDKFDLFLNKCLISTVLNLFVRESVIAKSSELRRPKSDNVKSKCIPIEMNTVLNLCHKSLQSAEYESTFLSSENEVLRNGSTIPQLSLTLKRFDDFSVSKTVNCSVILFLQCGENKVCSKFVLIQNIPPCDDVFNAEDEVDFLYSGGLTSLWISIIFVLMVVFIVIKALAKTSFRLLLRGRRMQLLPVSKVFGEDPTPSTSLLLKERPRQYLADSNTRCPPIRLPEQPYDQSRYDL